MIMTQAPLDQVTDMPSCWHKDVSLKVVLFVWRLFRDRLPTKVNLHRRQVLDVEAQFVLQIVAFLKHPIIYFFIVIFLVRFGMLLLIG